MKTVERAQGRWREILPQLGIETRFLRNKQGPCPICGGRTRFRFDDLDGRGTWFCNHCGAGAGLRLVMECNAWDFKTAVDEIDRLIVEVVFWRIIGVVSWCIIEAVPLVSWCIIGRGFLVHQSIDI